MSEDTFFGAEHFKRDEECVGRHVFVSLITNTEGEEAGGLRQALRQMEPCGTLLERGGGCGRLLD